VSSSLVSRNEDIGRLVDKGYAIAFDPNHYLVVRDIPYLDAQLQLKIGAIVSTFDDQGNDKIGLHNHEVFFAGSAPYGLDGKPIPNLGGGPTRLALSDTSKDVVVERSFSNKPMDRDGVPGAFKDFFEKIDSYVNIIAGPAMEKYKVKPYTFKQVDTGPSDSPFKVRDTLTSRAEIGDLAAGFKNDVIAIIGLGGTGAYVLDFIVKTPVREIRGFDMDPFHVHNAFRSAGRLELDEFGKTKAEVYRSRYDNFRTGLHLESKFIDVSCTDDLKDVTFAFVCVDKGASRAAIFDLLISLRIPYIDVGMGLDRKRGPLDGMLRTTHFLPERARELVDRGLAPLTDDPDNMYVRNVQISELNALNAAVAVLRFKQLRGFYFDDEQFDHLVFRIGDLKIHGNAENRDN
jgi:ThiF family